MPGAWVGLGVSAGDLGHGASLRELGEPLQSIAAGFLRVLDSHPDTALLLLLHKNPPCASPCSNSSAPTPGYFSEPLDYDSLVAAIRGSTLLLTDSGGLQEEAPRWASRLVLRRTTERPGSGAGRHRQADRHR